MTIRVAMWSGPRNISTALMRSWSSRADASVSDEPLYAHYLSELDEPRRAAHPGWADVLASQPTDWRAVVAGLTGPCERAVWYQKHMAHHLTGAMREAPGGLDWIDGLANVFLIRDPAAMIASFSRVIEDPTPEDLGLPQQVMLFERLRARTGRTPAVFDSRDILRDPRRGLGAMCGAVGVAFEEAMLAWPAGPHPSDGVWAPHWYASVNASTGFGPDQGERRVEVPERLSGVLAACQSLYDRLARHRVTD